MQMLYRCIDGKADTLKALNITFLLTFGDDAIK